MEPKIKQWNEMDTPYGKLQTYGKSALSDKELLSMILKTGTKNKNCIDLATEVLSSVENDLTALAKLSIRDLTQFKGIGHVKAMGIMAAIELGWRRRLSDGNAKKQISTSKDAYELFRPLIGALNHEEFWVGYLTRANNLISCKRLSSGGYTGTVVDSKIIYLQALEKKASCLVLGHNHPSDTCKPSDADIKLTKQLKDAGALLEIKVIDHIIVCGNRYFSFADEGMI